MGLVYHTGPEPEFFLFRRDGEGRALPQPHDRGGYFDLSTDRGVQVRKKMTKALAEEIGINKKMLEEIFKEAIK